MPRLQALKRDFVSQLQSSIASNLQRYRSSDPWVPLLPNFEQAEMPTPFDIKTFPKMLPPKGGDLHDLENAMSLHKAFPQLTPLQAQEPRLWVRLTHVELWKYMRERWPVEKYLPDRGMAHRYVLARYFVAQRQSRALLRNGVARLWWTANLTYDPDRKNPYELTEVLLSRLDIAQQLLERNFGRIKTLSHAFLNYLLQHRAECLDNGDKSRTLVRRLAKALNFHGGVCLLDCMKGNEIRGFLDREKNRIAAGGYRQEDDATAEEEVD